MADKNAMYDTGIHQNLMAKMALKPATMAIVVQVLALFSVLVTTWAAHWGAAVFFGVDLGFSMFTLVFLQAGFALYFCYLVGMAKWWRWIHFCFPVAAWVMSSWQIPNTVYLIGFIVTLSLYWTTFRTQVPFFPSRPVVWQQVAAIIPQDKPIRMVDIGSGLGDMSMHIAKARLDSVIEGIEIAPLPWLISVVRAKFRRSSAAFSMGDYRELNFADYDVIFAYLSPAAMPALWDKVQAEMKPGCMLISYEFEIKGVAPTQTIASDTREEKLYVWKLS